MSLNCGIVGLPNVGKSTIFSALTAAPAEVANYPFCTIDPNVGIVSVPDKRLEQISGLIPSRKMVPATIEFVDIAGLVAGASRGEGLGNRFLASIREVGLIAHVVRCFDDEDVTHVSAKVNPASDIETINIELALADLETVTNRFTRQARLSSLTKDAQNGAQRVLPILERLKKGLEDGNAARSLGFTQEERALVADLHLITFKPVIYVCNVDEEHVDGNHPYVDKVKEIAHAEGAEVVVICGKIEAEITALETEEERAEFLDAVGLAESGLNQLIRGAYHTLGLRTFFTVGPTEDRAWTFTDGMKAPQAAGLIHSDFERGFIRAEVYKSSDLFALGSEQKVREAGKLHLEGKEYRVKDGDVIHFRFNV